MSEQCDSLSHSFDQVKNEDIFTEVILAGRRKYFIDVKKIKEDVYYLVITESVKCNSKEDHSDTFKKFRIVLFPEDFSKFIGGISKAVEFIKKELMPNFNFDKFNKSSVITKENRDCHPNTNYESIVNDINV